MYYELFKIEDGVVKPLTAAEATIREVQQILKRDKGSSGDSDGRKKLFAYKELGAVYWIADFRSPGRLNGYEGQELIDDAIRNFGLPSTWEPDTIVKKLIEKYQYNNNGGIAAEVLTETTATFNFMLKTIKGIRNKLTEKLNAPAITEEDLKAMISMSNELLKIATGIPKMIKDIGNAKEMLKQTEDDTEIGRGGVPITSSMR